MVMCCALKFPGCAVSIPSEGQKRPLLKLFSGKSFREGMQAPDPPPSLSPPLSPLLGLGGSDDGPLRTLELWKFVCAELVYMFVSSAIYFAIFTPGSHLWKNKRTPLETWENCWYSLAPTEVAGALRAKFPGPPGAQMSKTEPKMSQNRLFQLLTLLTLF